MQIAVIGTGKTGSEVVKSLPSEELTGAFNRSQPPTLEALSKADAAIIFVPGHSVSELIPLLLESRLPVVWGSTGFQWPHSLNQELLDKGVTWIHGTYFSMGMALISTLLKTVGKSSPWLNFPSYAIHEIHHQQKKDKPSGTALSWKNWLDEKVEITSERTGEVLGTHQLTIEMPDERIEIKHETKDRRCFAEGAIWTARQLIRNNPYQGGLHLFENLAEIRREETCHAGNR